MPCISEAAAPFHAAVFYRGEEDFLAAVLPFVQQGVDAGDEVLVALPTRNLALLREALGRTAQEVELTDMAEVGRNPARAFAMFGSRLNEVPPGISIRVVGEPVWPGRNRDEYLACLENEALVNAAWADGRVATLCPYDAAHLPDDVLADARRTHPLAGNSGSIEPSTDYAWERVLAECNRPLRTDPTAATYRLKELADLPAAREFAVERARSLGMFDDRAGDLSLIVTELSTNSLEYTTDGCLLSLWRRGAQLVCEVRDEGHLDDPLAGRRPSSPQAIGGRGLLLVNALADLVRIHTNHSGTTIQAQLPLTVTSEERA